MTQPIPNLAPDDTPTLRQIIEGTAARGADTSNFSVRTPDGALQAFVAIAIGPAAAELAGVFAKMIEVIRQDPEYQARHKKAAEQRVQVVPAAAMPPPPKLLKP